MMKSVYIVLLIAMIATLVLAQEDGLLEKAATKKFEDKKKIAYNEYVRAILRAKAEYAVELQRAIDVEMKKGLKGLENAVNIKEQIEKLKEQEDLIDEGGQSKSVQLRLKLHKELIGTTWQWSFEKNQTLRFLDDGTALRVNGTKADKLRWTVIDKDRIVIFFGNEDEIVEVIRLDSDRKVMSLPKDRTANSGGVSILDLQKLK